MTTGGSGARFLTTHWSQIRAAAGSSAEARAALDALCRASWYPLYAFARRRGHARDEAHDLVQGFFASFLARNSLAGVSEEGGRFRGYLLAAFRHHCADERARARAAKRGGGVAPLALDPGAAEERYGREPADAETPERLFERKWALALLGRVLGRLEEEQRARGRGAAFGRLVPFLAARDEGEALADAAGALGLTPGAARVAVHRLRRRYRVLLLQEVAQTVDRPQDVEEEIRWLFDVLADAAPAGDPEIR
jgi:RNA polymerase sigma-70 factor (ECF subfamily)